MLGIAMSGGGAAAIWYQPSRVVATLIVLLFVVVSVASEIRLRRLAKARRGEDIGTFARGFDRRSPAFDPWIVRAVWDELQPYWSYSGGVAPLRPSDRLTSFVDPDDLDFEIVADVTSRSGRTLEGIERNPLRGRVETVGDLVSFVSLQPRLPTR